MGSDKNNLEKMEVTASKSTIVLPGAARDRLEGYLKRLFSAIEVAHSESINVNPTLVIKTVSQVVRDDARSAIAPYTEPLTNNIRAAYESMTSEKTRNQLDGVATVASHAAEMAVPGIAAIAKGLAGVVAGTMPDGTTKAPGSVPSAVDRGPRSGR